MFNWSKNPTLFASIVTSIATLVLAIITIFYLGETKKIREIADKAFQVDVSPKVFISNIVTRQLLNTQEKRLQIAAICEITNVGKTEAKNMEISYTILVGEKFQVPGTIEKAPYIFPTQTISFTTHSVGIKLNEGQVELAKNQLEKDKKITFPQNFDEKINLKIKINYFDHNNKEQSVSYLCDYRWDSTDWGIRIPTEIK